MIYPNNAFLRNLRKLSNSSSDVLTFVFGSPVIAVFDDLTREYDYTKFQKELDAILFGLERDGYIAYTNKPYQFYITDKGLHPYRQSWEAVKRFLIRSVLVPILVSTVTTIITLWIKGLLQ